MECLTLGRKWFRFCCLPRGVRCRTSQLPLSSSGKWARNVCSWPPAPFPGGGGARRGVSHRESEHRYFGSAIVLTIGMIKQIVYLFYSHLLHPRLQKSFVVGVDKTGTSCNVRNWSQEENKGFFEVGENEGISELLFSCFLSLSTGPFLLFGAWRGR